MTGTSENYYMRCMGSENELCKPVISQAQIEFILATVYELAEAHSPSECLEQEYRPKALLDLEHLQVADYGALGRVNDEQRGYIRRLHADEPIRPEELAYIALKSLISFSFSAPKSVDDIIRAATFDDALNTVLLKAASSLGTKLTSSDALLPYWGRLSFLRIMSQIPEDRVAKYGLDKVAVALIKRPAFNATTFALGQGALMGLNYALQPILKHLNRYLLHYFHTQEMAGPARMARALTGAIPIIFHFWKNVSLDKLHATTLFFDNDEQVRVHAITAHQVDFIMAHEIGHVVFDHPTRLRALSAAGGDTVAIRHEFEFAADAFAFVFFRSGFLDDKNSRPDEADSAGHSSITQYEDRHEAVYLLFAYIDFIDNAGRLLKSRLGETIKFRAELDSHPRARERFAKLDSANIADRPHATELIRYAGQFFKDVLTHADGLSDAELLEVVQEFL